jgi:hypothetical protein
VLLFNFVFQSCAASSRVFESIKLCFLHIVIYNEFAEFTKGKHPCRFAGGSKKEKTSKSVLGCDVRATDIGFQEFYYKGFVDSSQSLSIVALFRSDYSVHLLHSGPLTMSSTGLAETQGALLIGLSLCSV